MVPDLKVKEPPLAPCFHRCECPPEVASAKKGSAREKAAIAAMNGSGSNGGNGSGGNNNRALIKAISDSKVYQEYERAFNVLTGLPVALQPVESWQLPHHGQRNESPFCALVSQKSRACAACLQVWESFAKRPSTSRRRSPVRPGCSTPPCRCGWATG